MTNRFRDPVLRRAYDEAITAHAATSKVLFHAGQEHRGNGVAGPFWRGFHAEQSGHWDAASKQTLAYAYWRAGQDVRASQDEALTGQDAGV